MIVYDVFLGNEWQASFRHEHDAKRFVRLMPNPGKYRIVPMEVKVEGETS